MSKIIIKKAVAVQRPVKGKDGTTYVFNEQEAAYDDGSDFPDRFKISLADGQAPYPVGEYTVEPGAYFVNRFQSLELKRRFSLVPIVPTK